MDRGQSHDQEDKAMANCKELIVCMLDAIEHARKGSTLTTACVFSSLVSVFCVELKLCAVQRTT